MLPSPADALAAARDVERFCYRAVSAAEQPEEVTDARNMLRLAKGLRRKLEKLAPVEMRDGE